MGTKERVALGLFVGSILLICGGLAVVYGSSTATPEGIVIEGFAGSDMFSKGFYTALGVVVGLTVGLFVMGVVGVVFNELLNLLEPFLLRLVDHIK